MDELGLAPKASFCPVSHQVMQDPVMITVCGHTFDRASIEAWCVLFRFPSCTRFVCVW